MPYNNLISRSSAQAQIPEQVSNELIGSLANEAMALQMFRTIRMSTNQTRLPILAALPTAYFVNGDTGLKQTTQVDWSNKYINVEELAAIVPIPEAVLDDASFDVWGNIMPLLRDAIARALDAAIVFGTNKPASWPNALAVDAATAGNVINRSVGTARTDKAGIAGYFSDAYAMLEADGYDATGIIASTVYKGLLRNVRDANGQLIADPTYGVGIRYPMRGLWPTPATGAVEAIAGDFSQGILGIRQDITYKILDQAVIQDNSGVIQYNLAQQDMVALRVVFRCGFQIANTLNYDNTNASTRYPFVVMKQAA
ncbi:phage major capsid protein [Actinoplanes sp. N902-109]|uniref:phage major capsid protein n=1 Tax=Actinoplanes sp. (strain N902-109) TaxID=649831 RepID=UPI0003293DCB|nr:phage major capsid protein [Actinoplanes sp. N902-109]AGL13871.1 PEGA domain protein [Actinoplanes sp. N902-109]